MGFRCKEQGLTIMAKQANANVWSSFTTQAAVFKKNIFLLLKEGSNMSYLKTVKFL